MNGYQGTKYSSVASERNEIFKPLVAATVQQVLNRGVVYSVVGRGGELKGDIFNAKFAICTNINNLSIFIKVHPCHQLKLFLLMLTRLTSFGQRVPACPRQRRRESLTFTSTLA